MSPIEKWLIKEHAGLVKPVEFKDVPFVSDDHHCLCAGNFLLCFKGQQ